MHVTNYDEKITAVMMFAPGEWDPLNKNTP